VWQELKDSHLQLGVVTALGGEKEIGMFSLFSTSFQRVCRHSGDTWLNSKKSKTEPEKNRAFLEIAAVGDFLFFLSFLWFTRIFFFFLTKEHGYLWNLKFCSGFFFSETSSPWVAQAGLEVKILLPQIPECWDYRHVPPYLVEMFLVVRGIILME
jgi:hypothetical protein